MIQKTVFKVKHIKTLVNVCLYKSYFLWNNEIHCLEDSGPIGLSLMVVLAESYLQMIENRALQIARNLPEPVNPITHKRYVDDTHDRFNKKEHVEGFLKILNDQDPQIQFEPEYESEDKILNFLDTTIINTKEGHYSFKIHRKEAITNIQLKPNSCHDNKTKVNVFKGFLHRAKSICSKEYLQDEINFLINVFEENGYNRKTLENIVTNHNISKPKSTNNNKYISLPWIPTIGPKLKKVFSKAGLNIAFKSSRNLKSILTKRNKPQLPPNSLPGVYIIPCKCQSRYTGQTGAKVKKRTKEHQKAVFNGKYDESAISEHAKDCPHEVDWENVKTLSVQPKYFHRCVRESLEIRRQNTGPDAEKGMNKDYGQYVTTNTWNPLLDKVNKIMNK